MKFPNYDLQNKLIFIVVFFVLLYFFFKIDFVLKIGLIETNFKEDTILIILGNFAIAVYITSFLSKRQKDNELKINNCFKELDYLSELIIELRTHICRNNKSTLEDTKRRYPSLISLQIQLIKKYPFVSDEAKEKLAKHYSELNDYLTGEDTINDKYKFSALQLERTILNIKSDIL